MKEEEENEKEKEKETWKKNKIREHQELYQESARRKKEKTKEKGKRNEGRRGEGGGNNGGSWYLVLLSPGWQRLAGSGSGSVRHPGPPGDFLLSGALSHDAHAHAFTRCINPRHPTHVMSPVASPHPRLVTHSASSERSSYPPVTLASSFVPG